MSERNEHTQDYGGTCDSCANGVAKMGSRQCRVCLEREAEVDAHIDEEVAPMIETPTDVTAILARPMRVALVAYYDAKRALAQTKADDHALMGRTVRVLTDAEVLDEYERMLGRR